MGLNDLSIEKLRDLLKKKEISVMDIVRDIEAGIAQDDKHELPLNAYINFDINRIKKEAGDLIGNSGKI